MGSNRKNKKGRGEATPRAKKGVTVSYIEEKRKTVSAREDKLISSSMKKGGGKISQGGKRVRVMSKFLLLTKGKRFSIDVGSSKGEK